MGKGLRASMASPGMPLPPKLLMSANPESIGTPSFGVFMEASLHRQDQPSHRSLTIDSTSSPSHLPGVGW